MARKIILGLLGVLIVFVAFRVFKNLSSRKKPPVSAVEKRVTTVFVTTVKNTEAPITITTSGNLIAKDRVELFSEVQGIFEYSANPFKSGVAYEKGDLLLSINNKEEAISLKAQKSSLYNQLVLLMPDLRLDFKAGFKAGFIFSSFFCTES